MEYTNNQNINFNLPESGGINLVDSIDDILTKHGLEETDEEFCDKDEKGIEPRAIIMRDAAYAMFENKMPDDKLTDLLSKHLEIDQEKARKMVQDIKGKIIPILKSSPVDDAKERINYQTIPTPLYDKKPAITNVEENAKKIEGEKKFTEARKEVSSLERPILTENPISNGPPTKQTEKPEEPSKVKTVIQQDNQKKGPDQYRESID